MVLLLLGLPFLDVSLGFPDDRVLSPDAQTRQVAEVLRQDFSSEEASALTVVVPDVDAAGSDADPLDAYAAALSTTAGVARVDAVTGTYIGGSMLPFDARARMDGPRRK